ncbi:MAG: FHA domain-containing protein [Desulfuromonadaceae bacterium]
MRKMFLATHKTALLDMEQVIRERYSSGILIDIKFAAPGFARTYQQWQQHYLTIIREIRPDRAIRVSRGQSIEYHELIIHEEAGMQSKSIFEGIQSFFGINRSDDAGTRHKSAVKQPNDLLAALADEIQAEECNPTQQFLGGDLYVNAITITPQSQAAMEFVARCQRHEERFKRGIAQFINSLKNKYVKASSEMTVTVEMPVFGYESCEPGVQYTIRLDLCETDKKNRTNITSGSTNSFGKKTLNNPLQITVYDGSPDPIHAAITHLPCRVNRLSSAEIQIVTSPYISKNHLVIELASDGSLIVSDLGSTNGTFIDGRDIRGNNHRLELNETVVLDLGFGKSSDVIEANRNTKDFSQFPRLVIAYGEQAKGVDQGTPDAIPINSDGTPEPFVLHAVNSGQSYFMSGK